jgi:hypothetical protein
MSEPTFSYSGLGALDWSTALAKVADGSVGAPAQVAKVS